MTQIWLASALLLCVMCSVVSGQTKSPLDQIGIFDRNGKVVTIQQIIEAVGGAEVVFLGEQHDDAVGHAVQLEIFKRVAEKYASSRKPALSLEMFERDVQIVLDEYLQGSISEQHFLLSSRPWPNYKTDYRPLFEFAKEKKFPVIAANAPRRYINMVSRNGRDALKGLSPAARKWVAPLPYAQPSETYAAKFRALMKGAPEAQRDMEKVLASQALWDATMANSVATYLKKNKQGLAIHLNGSFHTESRLGTVEHLLKYRPRTKVLVVTMRSEADPKTFVPDRHSQLGDFVILTPPKGRSPVSMIIDRMDQHQKALKSLKAEYTMEQSNAQLRVSDKFTGAVHFLPPVKTRKPYVRVDSSRPQENLVMIGDDYQLYRPQLNVVYTGKMVGENGELATALSFMHMSRQELKDNYSLAYLGEEQLADGIKTWRIEITPRKRTNIQAAELWVDGNGMPVRAKTKQPNSDTTTVALSNIQKNIPLSSSIFRLSLPATVKRIRT